jgi:hypothetical protein
MAYKYSELEKQALEAIEKHKLFFIADVTSYLPCSMGTFYDFKLQESEAIKEALAKVKIEIKVSMRSKWYKSSAPALQLALYKLIAMPEEIKALQMNYTDHTTNGKDVTGIKPIEWVKSKDVED